MERKTYNLAYGKKFMGQDQSEKKIWIPIGRMYVEPESEHGERISIRLDSIPCDPNFTGMITAFPYEPRNGQVKNGTDAVNDIPF